MILKEELEGELVKAYKSTLVHSKMFFPGRFHRPFCSIHKSIADLLDGPYQQVAIAAPRGTGKTSLLGLGYVSKKVLFRDSKFIIYVTSSADYAIEQTENLKEYMIGSPLIRDLFGDLKGARWSKDRWIIEWEDGDKTMILPRGAGQSIRGALYRDDRPDLIVCDDLENDEEVESEIQRAKLRKWFFNSLINCIDRGSDKWKIVVIDTIKHEDCMLQNLLDNPKWKTACLQICTDDFKSLWPEFITDDEIKELRDEAISSDNLDGFYREYMNLPICTEDAGFKAKDVKYYDEPGDLKKVKLEGFVIVDPAKTVNPKSAPTSILGGGVDVAASRVYFRDLIVERLHPDETMDRAFDMCQQLGARILAVEVTSLNEYITYPFINEIRRRKLNIEFIELKPRASKELRAKALIPFYRRGQIYHNRHAMGVLEKQMFSFPRPKRWDALDCAGYIVGLLSVGGRFFMPEDVENESEKTVEDEYSDLAYSKEDDFIDGYESPDIGIELVEV